MVQYDETDYAFLTRLFAQDGQPRALLGVLGIGANQFGRVEAGLGRGPCRGLDHPVHLARGRLPRAARLAGLGAGIGGLAAGLGDLCAQLHAITQFFQDRKSVV